MAGSEPHVSRYSDLDSLSRSLGSSIATDLRGALSARKQASLVVSGGRSPVKLFEHLSKQSLDWERIQVRLVDERWVDPLDASSNERLVRENLLQGRAAGAGFAGLKNAAATPALGAATAWQNFSSVHRPFDVLVLGMGDDGHTASLFPQSPNLAEGLNIGAAPGCIGMTAPSAPKERMSLNLAALLQSSRIVLLLNGESKWNTFLEASKPGPVELMPVRAVLRQSPVPVEVVWAP